MPTLDAKVDHGYCWDVPAKPAPELLNALKSGPFQTPKRDELIATLRRETVA